MVAAPLARPGLGMTSHPRFLSVKIARGLRAAVACLWLAWLLPAGAGPFRDVGDGLALRIDRVPAEPWAIQIVRFERSRTNLFLLPTMGLGDRLGLGTLTEQIAAIPAAAGEPVAAINGDFYQTENESFPGDPRGLFIARGELVSAPAERDCFWLDTNGAPHIGIVRPEFTVTWPDGTVSPLLLNEEPDGGAPVLFTAAGIDLVRRVNGTRIPLLGPTNQPWAPVQMGGRYTAQVGTAGRKQDRLTLGVPASLRAQATALRNGGTVQLSFGSQPSLAGVTTAIGGGPALVRGGKVQPARVVKANVRHPRSALGWNDTHFFLVTVDGRQPGHSDGMTLPELASYLVQLGCTEAMNLDGGGSTELWLRGKIVNQPCYGYERNTATGLVLLKRGNQANTATRD